MRQLLTYVIFVCSVHKVLFSFPISRIYIFLYATFPSGLYASSNDLQLYLLPSPPPHLNQEIECGGKIAQGKKTTSVVLTLYVNTCQNFSAKRI